MHVLWTINQPQTPAGWIMRNYWEEWGLFELRDGVGQTLFSMGYLEHGIVVIMRECVSLCLSMCVHVYLFLSLTNRPSPFLKNRQYILWHLSQLTETTSKTVLFIRKVERVYVTINLSITDYWRVTRLRLSSSVRIYLILWSTLMLWAKCSTPSHPDVRNISFFHDLWHLIQT